MEFRAVGATLSFLYNHVPQITARDAQLSTGRAAILFGEGVAIRKLEWMKPQ